MLVLDVSPVQVLPRERRRAGLAEDRGWAGRARMESGMAFEVFLESSIGQKLDLQQP